ncbi:MAG: 1-acyl-sn-glycerol-3-phosphate acyltransferase [Gemmobacter sp.]|jgi:1-acyl-sn-glycerol-3-phosphate acyltransferase|nr:1-acyl-sn-glycerol-3-phosphate acyltransferase [Gemmobacter sp.]
MGPLRLGLQYVLSFVFIVQMYLAMAVIGLLFLPWALFSARGAYAACHSYCFWVIWSARLLVGLRSEVRGTPPEDAVLIAAKHQSFFDILLIFSALPRGRFIMKKELTWTPILGQYAKRIGCIAVDRGRRGAAIRLMLAEAKARHDAGGQLIIYAQGTRVPPGEKRPYKIGTGAIYADLGQDCVPVATNVGVFWPKRSMLRMPGLAVVDFLPRIPAGKPVAEFMAELEQVVEARSEELLDEAGFKRV